MAVAIGFVSIIGGLSWLSQCMPFFEEPLPNVLAYAEAVLGMAVIALLGRAIYLSRTEPAVEVLQTIDVSMEHKDNSAGTLY